MIEQVAMTFFLAWYGLVICFALLAKTSNDFQLGIVLAGVFAYVLELGAGYTVSGLTQLILTICLFKIMCDKPLPGKKAPFKLLTFNGLMWMISRITFRTILILPLTVFHGAALQYALSSTTNLAETTLRYLSYQLTAANWFYLFLPLPLVIWFIVITIRTIPAMWPHYGKPLLNLFSPAVRR